MLNNEQINRQAAIKVAKALGELNEQVVFVGGAMVSLYADVPGAEGIRETKDIDITFQITTVSQLESLREQLRARGFVEAADEKVLCRFKLDYLLVDVMSTQEIGWAPGNRWLAKGFDQSITTTLEDVEIRILSLPYFLATKMEAFFDRGVRDLYASKDLEDLIYLFNHVSDIVDQVVQSERELALYLKTCVNNMMTNPLVMGAIPGHLYFANADEQLEIMRQKLVAIASM